MKRVRTGGNSIHQGGKEGERERSFFFRYEGGKPPASGFFLLAGRRLCWLVGQTGNAAAAAIGFLLRPLYFMK